MNPPNATLSLGRRWRAAALAGTTQDGSAEKRSPRLRLIDQTSRRERHEDFERYALLRGRKRKKLEDALTDTARVGGARHTRPHGALRWTPLAGAAARLGSARRLLCGCTPGTRIQIPYVVFKCHPTLRAKKCMTDHISML